MHTNLFKVSRIHGILHTINTALEYKQNHLFTFSSTWDIQFWRGSWFYAACRPFTLNRIATMTSSKTNLKKLNHHKVDEAISVKTHSIILKMLLEQARISQDWPKATEQHGKVLPTHVLVNTKCHNRDTRMCYNRDSRMCYNRDSRKLYQQRQWSCWRNYHTPLHSCIA